MWEQACAMPDNGSEFFVSVQVYVSNKTFPVLRKPTRPKADKRDSTRSLTTLTDKKLKEKSSWLSLSRTGTNAAEQWRAAICKLTEEEEGCRLNVYIEGSILYQSVPICSLLHTDIRPVHPSMFDRRNCIGIFYVTGYNPEPLYLHFDDVALMNTWFALLRSYAIPEIHGNWLSPEEGGMYRMWRAVEVKCLQGRNLGSTRAVADEGTTEDMDGDANDVDVFCEVLVNDVLCGRTTVKKGIGSPEWHESFVFPDLPPFEYLEFAVWHEKRVGHPQSLGSVRVYLANFRRGEHVEGWFPVLCPGPGASTLNGGELRLKIRVDEEIVLPSYTYEKMMTLLQSRNYLDWMFELETKVGLKGISHHIIAIAISKNALIQNIIDLANREVDGSVTSHNTLFRGNTVFTKTVELFMAWHGAAFLEASIGTVIRRLCSEKVTIEVDPSRRKNKKGQDRNVNLLVTWCDEVWKQIYETRMSCPQEMRVLFEHIRRLVEKRYGIRDDQNRELPLQSVSAFCFLRFIVPAILHPHLFGILPGLPEAPVQRSLTLIAKVIQSLANLNASIQKEEFMRGLKDFLTANMSRMREYIAVISAPDGEHASPSTSSVWDQHDRVRILNTIRQRSAVAPVLVREAIPTLPHVLDLAKHLAVLSSVVVRHSRALTYRATPAGAAEARELDAFCNACLEVEGQALLRVSHLAAHPRLEPEPELEVVTRAYAGIAPAAVPLPASPTSPRSLFVRTRRESLGRGRHGSQSTRPSTAPSPVDVPGPFVFPEVPPPPGDAMPYISRLFSWTPDQPRVAGADAAVAEVEEERLNTASTARPHGRSSSTDSALQGRRGPTDADLPPVPVVPADGGEGLDGRRRGLFRGILARRAG